MTSELRGGQVNILNNMAEMVTRRVEQSWALALRQQKQQQQQFLDWVPARGLKAYTTPVMFVDTATDPWEIRYCNSAAAALAGVLPALTSVALTARCALWAIWCREAAFVKSRRIKCDTAFYARHTLHQSHCVLFWNVAGPESVFVLSQGNLDP